MNTLIFWLVSILFFVAALPFLVVGAIGLLIMFIWFHTIGWLAANGIFDSALWDVESQAPIEHTENW